MKNMNPIEKPKRVKLFKNRSFSGKKQKIQKNSISSDSTTVEDTRMKKRIKLEVSLDANSDFVKLKSFNEANNYDVVEDNDVKVKVENFPQKKQNKRKGENEIQQHLKRKNNFQDSFPKRKGKPKDMTRKDFKMLHLDRKPKSDQKVEPEGKNKVAVKPQPMGKNEWKKKKLEKRGKVENLELSQKLKLLWEKFRRGDCKPAEKKELIKETCGILKGRVKEFSYAHDTVRVLETVISDGSDEERALIFTELQNDIPLLVKSKYGKFTLVKFLKYGSKEQKNAIMKTFYGNVVALIQHTEAAQIVEMAFNEYANSSQRFELVQEFYGPTYKFFKATDCHSIADLFAKEPDKKDNVLKHMKETLMRVLQKSVVKHSIVHHVLWQFMQHCDKSSKSEIIEALREVVPEILHTKDGSRAAMHCVWFGTAKDRKVILKSMKTFVSKIAMEEHGHMVLLALFDSFDDTKLIAKRIIAELETNLFEISQNHNGRKVLIYLLNPRDPHYFHPDVISILKVGDGNETSKKDPEVRQHELKVAIAQPLLDLIIKNIQNLYKDNPSCLFTLTILTHALGNKEKAYESIADLAAEPYTTENKNVHVIEHPGSHFLLIKLLLQDRYGPNVGTFSEVLIKVVPKCVFRSWVECNRGSFLLVRLLETKIPSVVQRIKEELDGFKKYIAKKPYKGAQILLEKLKTHGL